MRRRKKVGCRKQHLLRVTDGLVLKAKTHSAEVPDQDDQVATEGRPLAPRTPLSPLWVNVGYQGRGRE